MRSKNRIIEEYLVIAAQRGDRHALQKLVALRAPRLLAHAVRLLRDVEQARDATQDAWIDIMRNLPKLSEPRAFPAWATRIVTRKCAGIIRKNQHDRELRNNFERLNTQQQTLPSGEIEADKKPLRQAISTLPKEHAATIALFYLEEMSVAEVSVALDIPIGTVKTRLMHAREKLKQVLKGKIDDQTG